MKKRFVIGVVVSVILAAVWIMAGPYDYSAPGIQNWDSTRPADSEPGYVLGASSRQIKKCVEEWVDVQHNRDGTHKTNIVTEAMIQSNAVTTSKIANGAVLAEKIANGTLFLHGSDGYETFPSGLIMQWGTGPTVSGNGTITVSFTKPFPTSCLWVGACKKGAVQAQQMVGVASWTTTNAVMGYSNVNDSGNLQHQWLAFGY